MAAMARTQAIVAGDEGFNTLVLVVVVVVVGVVVVASWSMDLMLVDIGFLHKFGQKITLKSMKFAGSRLELKGKKLGGSLESERYSVLVADVFDTCTVL